MEIALHLNVAAAPAAAEQAELERQLTKVALTLIELRRTKRQENLHQLVELFVGNVEPAPLDIARAKLEAQAYREILAGGRWATAVELGELAQLGRGNPVATVNRWKKDRKIFAIHRDGRDYFPRYGLGPDFRPLPALAEILKVLPWEGERLAAWFESTSSFLDGQRPREVIASNADWVLQAARDAIEAEQFAG